MNTKKGNQHDRVSDNMIVHCTFKSIVHSWQEVQLTCDNVTTELSSFIASSTISRFGFAFWRKIAVASSSCFSCLCTNIFGNKGLTWFTQYTTVTCNLWVRRIRFMKEHAEHFHERKGSRKMKSFVQQQKENPFQISTETTVPYSFKLWP